MVLENLIAYILDRYLGDYIENLDTKKLKIDVWKGNVVLQNLYLKPNALADLDLPITISVGFLEKLTLQIRWQDVYTQPTKATIDGLYLLVVPKTEVEYNAEREEKEQHEAKMREVRKLEELRKEREAEKNGKNENSNDTFIERIQLQVIRNIELSIRNIHIVYEDRSTKPEKPFSFGITLNYITLHATTDKWEPTVLKEDTPLIHKLGDLSAFSIYWNSNIKTPVGLSRGEIVLLLKNRIAQNNFETPEDISYILRPMNIKARFVLAMKPRQENFKHPMFDIKIDLEEISLNINRDQYSDFLDLLEFQDYLTAKSKFIKYRADIDPKMKFSRQNWFFAFNAILHEEIRPRYESYKWENIKAHLDRRREYQEIHFQELTGKLTKEQKNKSELLERKLDIFNLTFVRRTAEIEAKKKKDEEPKSWWGNFSNWWSGNKENDVPELDLEKVISPKEKEKLFEAIGYAGEDTSSSTYPEEYIDIDLVIRLNLLDLNIWSKINENDKNFQIISRAVIPETDVTFQRRPTTNDIALSVGLGSFQVFGMSNDPTEIDRSNLNRPVLAQPPVLTRKTDEKIFQIEFETNPLDKKSDYKLKVLSQSLEIKYHAPTINKLVEYFESENHRNLQGVKQAAYSTYTDVKHRSFILMKHNIEKIKVLDIYVDLQSSYFLLPENGIYHEGAAAICMDFGHLTLKRGNDQNDLTTDLNTLKDIDEARELSYTQFKLKLEDVQLIFTNRNESWEKSRKERDTRFHLIKPMEVEMDVDKCIYSDDAVLPAWKIGGNVPNVEIRLSDKRLFQIIDHLQSVPFPESKNVSSPTNKNEESNLLMRQISTNDVDFPYGSVEFPASIKRNFNFNELNESEENEILSTIDKKTKNSGKNETEGQLTQLELTFRLSKIDLHVDEVFGFADENERTDGFLRLRLESIVAKTKMKTFDMEFEASLGDFIVDHLQFVGKDNRPLRLLSAQSERNSNEEKQKDLANFNFLHTSPENPLFKSKIYGSIENRAQFHVSKLVVTLQLEALLSILRFYDVLINKLARQFLDDETTKKKLDPNFHEEQRRLERSISTVNRTMKKNEISTTPTLKINADLEEFRVIIASKISPLFDIQVQGVKAEISQAVEKTLINLILTDLRVLDPNEAARFRQIVSQQNGDKDLLRVVLTLFNYPEAFRKELDVFDCDVKVEFAKANIFFLFKHIDAILNFLDSLNITKAALDLTSNETEISYDEEKNENPFKVHLDISFNAPNIIIPTSSFSDEALLFDLGRLTLKTRFYDDPKLFLVEQQNVLLENVLASRICFDRENQIRGEVILLECAQLSTLINRLIYSERVRNEPAVFVKVQWNFVHFRLSKGDYSCVMKVLLENFTENIRDQLLENEELDRYHYRQEEKEKQDEALRNAVIQKQKQIHGDEIFQTVKIRAEIQKLTLTLFLAESNLTIRRAPRDENLKLANVEIEMFEALFRQNSDSSYKAMGRIKNFLLDDLRQTNSANSVTRMMDRHFTVDPNQHMLIAAFDFKPKNETNPIALRQLNARLESLYICISLDYLMTLQDFFISALPTSSSNDQNEKNQTNSNRASGEINENEQNRGKLLERRTTTLNPLRTPSHQITNQQITMLGVDAQIETRVDVIVKNPEIIVLEDQHNANLSCLVLDLAFQMRLVSIGDETKIYGWLKDLTVYSSNFAELRDTKSTNSKIKYRILQPSKADVIMIMDKEQQKVDIRVSDIIVSIAPAAVRTLIAVTSSLGSLQTTVLEEQEKVQLPLLFVPKPFEDDHFWFTKHLNDLELTLEPNDLAQKISSAPPEMLVIKVQDEKEEKKQVMKQQLIFTLETIEVKLEVGLGSATKSVVAMCLSHLTADLKNWSSDMSLSSTVNVEAALFNENLLSWEPLIEPTMDPSGSILSPWCITCSILPNSVFPEEQSSIVQRLFQTRKNTNDSNSKQLIIIRADQLLNITLTKTGLDLVLRLSALFNDVYNKGLPATEDDDQPMLAIKNLTGRGLLIDHFNGVEYGIDPAVTWISVESNQLIPLLLPNERQPSARLSVIEEQDGKHRQEFSVHFDDVVKNVSINRTWKRVYDIGPSANPQWPIQLLCDAQIHNDRRRVVLSSIVKIYNNTNMTLVLLDIDSIDPKQRHRIGKIEKNEDFCVPIDLIYARTSAPIFISIENDGATEEVDDFFSFDWFMDESLERQIKLNDGTKFFFSIYKESNEAYSENTDQLDRKSFSIHIHSAVDLTNLLPVDIQCSIDDKYRFNLKPSEIIQMPMANKISTFIFSIPSYNNAEWLSEPINLNNQIKERENEHLMIFHSSSFDQNVLKLLLRIDSYHESLRLSLYSPFWVLNRTDIKLEFQLENQRSFIDCVEAPILICPERSNKDSGKKGTIRPYLSDSVQSHGSWSEKFSLDVIHSTGIASCKVNDDRTYMICVDIVTASFGLTKIVTLTPSVVIINKSSSSIDVVETINGQEQSDWLSLKTEEIIPFWPRNIVDGLLSIRYTHNQISSSPFVVNKKHRTLLRMDDEEKPAIYVEVTTNEVGGARVLFTDYKSGDAPLLIVNCLSEEAISYCQLDDIRTTVLPPKNYVYYTWSDPIKPRELTVSCGSNTKTLSIKNQFDVLGRDGNRTIIHTIFVDGVQTVLLFSDDENLVATASGVSALEESMSQRIKIGIHDIGLSIVNDITREEVLYVSLNKSKVIWTETKKSRVRPLAAEINGYLEEIYQTHVEKCEANPENRHLQTTKYQINDNRQVIFHENQAILSDLKGQTKVAKRQALDGLWIEYAWSTSNATLHLRINRVQIDNQLPYTLFPVTLYPVVSRAQKHDYVEKPFIEMSVFETKTSRSNVIQFKYFKLLVQEFAIKIDQGLVVALLAFFRQEKRSAGLTKNMEFDLAMIDKPLSSIINTLIEAPSGETEMYFDKIHLSPLKIHISFSMHGSKPSEQLLAEYPFITFLLRTLNVAEVQDVVLRLAFYERLADRFTMTRLTNEVGSHYQHQFMKQIHILVFGLDVLGNPFGVIRGLAAGVESFFYEPYKGAIEGPMEFAEGVATGIRTLFGSAVGGAAGAFSKITGVLGKGLATLTFDEEYKASRARRKDVESSFRTDIAVGGKNVVMGFFDGVTGVVKKPVSGAKQDGATGFVKGLGKGFLGLVTRPTGGIVDFASTSLDLIKRTAEQEETIRRVRFPRHVGRDGLVRPYINHEAIGFYILNRLQDGKYSTTDTYIAHITCSDSPPSWFMATSKRLLFVTEISFLGQYELDWDIDYTILKEEPTIKPNLAQIQILTKEVTRTGTLKSNRSYGKMIKYRNIAEAKYIVDRIINAMHTVGL